MYYIAICDDDNYYIEKTKQILIELTENKEEITFLEYNTGEELLNAIPYISTVDLLILDIIFPTMHGDEIAEKFRQYFPNSLLVFCSGIAFPTTESFKTTPFRFLIKRFSDDIIISEFKVIMNEMRQRKSEPYIFAHWHNNSIRVAPSEITHIANHRTKTRIFIAPSSQQYAFESTIYCEDNLAVLYERLKDYHFVYAHNSYIVNLRYIKRNNTRELQLMDGTRLSIARSKEKQLRLALRDYSANKY
ncbi:MAG: response regulator [Lachnospiraceae bacterium]|nr:response regulator [Lachnospiraceae bacterium]